MPAVNRFVNDCEGRVTVTTHVRISNETKTALEDYAANAGVQTMDEAINRLLAFQREADFWEQCERGCLALRNDPTAWAEELAERALWDNTLMDGLSDA